MDLFYIKQRFSPPPQMLNKNAHRDRNLSKCSSFSSFEEEQPRPPSFCIAQPSQSFQIDPPNVKIQMLIDSKTDSEVFSQFEEEGDLDGYQQSFRKIKEAEIQKQRIRKEIEQSEMLKRKAEDSAMKELLLQIDGLKRQNCDLKQENLRLNKTIIEIEQRNQVMLAQQKTYRQNCVHERKERIEQLLKEIGRLKETAHGLKMNLQKTLSKSERLEIRNCQLEKELDANEWKSGFIELFLDMLLKISGEIEGDWSMKKKVQMGWKITKNMIHKALDAGIKPPKIEKGDYSVMKSAAYRGDNI